MSYFCFYMSDCLHYLHHWLKHASGQFVGGAALRAMCMVTKFLLRIRMSSLVSYFSKLQN